MKFGLKKLLVVILLLCCFFAMLVFETYTLAEQVSINDQSIHSITLTPTPIPSAGEFRKPASISVQNMINPTPTPLLEKKADNVKADVSAAGYPSLTVRNTAPNSITWTVAFPQEGVYGNRFMWYDYDKGKWTVIQPDCYLNSGDYTITGLTEGTKYLASMAWYENAVWKGIQVQANTKWNTPSLKKVKVTSNSISINSVFPRSGDAKNGLGYYDPIAGKWMSVPGQGSHSTNGEHTITGLQPNTCYIIFMSWWDYDAGKWADLPWLYVTTESDSNIPKSVLDAIEGVSGDTNEILVQGCLAVMGFPMGNTGPNGNGVDGDFGSTSKYWLLEYKFKKGLSIKNASGWIEAIINQQTIDSLLQSVRNNETMKSLGITKGSNPTKQEVITYITNTANKKGIPAELALATAWCENEFVHFNQNGSPGPNSTNDWGIMQINCKSHPEAFEGAFDNDPSTPDIVRNWKENIDWGLKILVGRYDFALHNDDGVWGATGISLGEGKMGPASTRAVTNLARATYCCYNKWISFYRYRLTYKEALSQNLDSTCYGDSSNRDSYGYDKRDNRFWDIYYNKKWK